MRELALLQHIYGNNTLLPECITIPPGDDMGGIQIGDTHLLVSTDQLIEDVHFNAQTPLEFIARKAVARNLSDVAAMAATPVGAVATACLPKRMHQAQAYQLCDEMRRWSERYSCPLFGGDIAIAGSKLHIALTVFAKPGDRGAVRRSGAEPGDIVFVSGQFGGAWTGPSGPVSRDFTFEPRIELARRLAEHPDFQVNSMIDVSDGLARDFKRICEMSGVFGQLDGSLVPVHSSAHVAASGDGLPAFIHALKDGEDYELCFTVSEEAASGVLKEIEGVPITRVGRILETATRLHAGEIQILGVDGEILSINDLGWEHHI